MISAGNDIVALALVNKQRTLQFSFYSKILSVSEQALYRQSENEQIPFENYVWLLWSVKESVYKYLKRIDPALVFSPTNIVIQYIEIPVAPSGEPENGQWENSGTNDSFYSGKVIFDSYSLYFRSKISEAWIASVVNGDDNFDDVCWGVQTIENSSYKVQSQAARVALIDKLSPFFGSGLRVEKSAVGYPVIVNDAGHLPVPASLAHDGCFVSYSFLLDPENVCG